MGVLRPILPDRYSPLQPNGNGLQGIDLTELPEEFAEVLVGLIGEEARALLGASSVAPVFKDDKLLTGDDLDVWERRLEEQVEADPAVNNTERQPLVRARIGQGLFKQRVMQIETRAESLASKIRFI